MAKVAFHKIVKMSILPEVNIKRFVSIFLICTAVKGFLIQFFLFNPLGNGYCRSEAAVAVLLTKKSMAKRIYSTVLNAGNNTDGYKEQGKLILSSHRRQICLKSSSMSEISSVNTFLLALEDWHYYKSWHYMCRRCRSLSPSASSHTLLASVFTHDTWLSVRAQGI